MQEELKAPQLALCKSKVLEATMSPLEYNGERVVTHAMIDACHQRKSGTSKRAFSDNKKRFELGIDYYVLDREGISGTFNVPEIEWGNPDKRVLISERGYLKLVKTFRDDLSWDVQGMLIDSYFRAKILDSAESLRSYLPIVASNESLAQQISAGLLPVVREHGRQLLTLAHETHNRISHIEENVECMRTEVAKQGEITSTILAKMGELSRRRKVAPNDVQTLVEFTSDVWGCKCPVSGLIIILDGIRTEDCEIDHNYSPSRNRLEEVWLLHREINRKLYSDPLYRHQLSSQFGAYQSRLARWQEDRQPNPLFKPFR